MSNISQKQQCKSELYIFQINTLYYINWYLSFSTLTMPMVQCILLRCTRASHVFFVNIAPLKHLRSCYTGLSPSMSRTGKRLFIHPFQWNLYNCTKFCCVLQYIFLHFRVVQFTLFARGHSLLPQDRQFC